MSKRPICIINGCNNLAHYHHKHKDGSYSYHKLCGNHHRKKYNIKIVNHTKKNKKKRDEALNIDRSTCTLCGWNKAPCDRHRIKYGCNGGEYTLGNVLSVCPNCHRLIHMNLLKIK